MDSSVISILLGALGFGAGAVVGTQYQKKQDEELYSQRIERRVMEVGQQHDKDLRAQIAQITQEYEAKLAAAKTVTQNTNPPIVPAVSAVQPVVDEETTQITDRISPNSVDPVMPSTDAPQSDSADAPATITLSPITLSPTTIRQSTTRPYGDLVRQARDSQPHIRIAAAQSLGQKLRRNPSGMNLAQLHELGLLSTDHDPSVAIAAVTALGQIPDQRVIPYLLQANRSGYGAVVKAAGAALQRYKNMALPKVAAPQSHPPEPRPKTKAVQFRSITRTTTSQTFNASNLDPVTPDLPVVEPLSQVSIANDKAIRSAMQGAKIAAWGDSQQVQYVPSLLQYAQSPDSAIRKEVATALAKIAHHQPQALATKPVISTLGRLSLDRRVSVRYAAIVALGKLQDQAVIPYLQQAQGANASAVVKVAAQVLRNLQPLPETPPVKVQPSSAKAKLIASAQSLPNHSLSNH